MRDARRAVVFLVLAAVALALTGAASSDTPPVIDFSVSLTGPTDGNAGDTLTYTISVTSNGPDTLTAATAVEFLFGDETDGGLQFVEADGRCPAPSPAGPGIETARCDFDGPFSPGETRVIHLTYRVTQRLGGRIWAGVSYFGEVDDPDSSNDNAQLQVMPPPASKISNTTAPTIAGSAAPGSTLTADPGTWSPSWSYAYRYEWDRCTPDMTDCYGQTGPSSYTVSSLDAGCRIAVFVSADSGLPDNAGVKPFPAVDTDPVPGGPCNPASGPIFPPGGPGGSGGGGSGGSGSAPAAPTAPDQILNAGPPVVSGTPAVGSTLTAAPGSWQPAWSYGYTYRWYRCDPAATACAAATADRPNARYVVVRADAGCLLEVEVIAGDSVATSAAVRSAPTGRVGGGPCSAAAARAIVAVARLTPGARAAAVTQATLARTICRGAWVRRATPPASSLRALELRQLATYHDTGGAAGYVEDQLIPVDLGGAPRAAANLWPQPAARARADDAVEVRLNHRVCAGALSLRAAQAQIVELKRTKG